MHDYSGHNIELQAFMSVKCMFSQGFRKFYIIETFLQLSRASLNILLEIIVIQK